MKQVRWSCPLCSSGVLAPSRPRKVDVRRWCLACSEKTGKLIERVPISLAAKRKERKRKQARKYAAKKEFKRPDSYYFIGGHNLRYWTTALPDRAVRVRTTKGPGATALRGEVMHFRTGPWADRFDAEAQARIADAKWSVIVIRKLTGRLPPLDLLRAVRAHASDRYGLDHWRPRSLARLEIELADILRKRAAVKALGAGSSFERMERSA